MTSFDKREQAFEKKHAYEEKMGFDVEARLSKLYGLWAAEKIGLSGDDADAYAREVIEANLEEPGFDDILRKVRADFDAKNIDISDEDMSCVLNKTLIEAKTQVKDENSN